MWHETATHKLSAAFSGFHLCGVHPMLLSTLWRHHMETLSALLALCEGNPPVTGGFPSQKASNTGFGVFFNAILDKPLGKQSSCGWFEIHWCSLWRCCSTTIPVACVSICDQGFDPTKYWTMFHMSCRSYPLCDYFYAINMVSYHVRSAKLCNILSHFIRYILLLPGLTISVAA